MEMHIRNRQTWILLRRIEVRDFAHSIGNVALAGMSLWPKNGDGRAVKSCAEKLISLFEVSAVGDFSKTVIDFEKSILLIDSICRNKYFIDNISKKYFNNRHGKEIYFKTFIDEYLDDVSKFVNDSRNFILPNVHLSKISIDKIAKVVPDQQIAPIYFKVVAGKLEVEKRKDHEKKGSTRAVEESRRQLVKESNILIEHLNQANSDSRLIELLEEISYFLKSRSNVIQIGISLIPLEVYCSRVDEELSLIIFSRLRGFSIGVSHYLGQFKEWDEFLINSIDANFDDDDIESALHATEEITRALSRASADVAPEIPKSFALLAAAIRAPRKEAKRAAWAALRAIENLVIVISKECVDIVHHTVEGTKEGAKLGGKWFALASLLYMSISQAGSLTTHAFTVMKASWLLEIVKLVGLK